MSLLIHNGKFVQTNHKYMIPGNGSSPAPVDPTIQISANHIGGDYYISLLGNGNINVDWGGGDTEVVELYETNPVTIGRSFFGNKVINITGPAVANVTRINGDYQQTTTGLEISAGCTALKDINFPSNQITSCPTHPEWVNLEIIDLNDSTGLSSFVTYSAWTKLKKLHLRNCGLSSINTYASWSDLDIVNLESNSLTAFQTFGTWKLSSLEISYNQISSLDTFASWPLIAIQAMNNNLTSFVARNWPNLYRLNLEFNALAYIDDILITLDSLGTSDKNLFLDGGANAGISTPAGQTAYNNLVSRGWSAYTN